MFIFLFALSLLTVSCATSSGTKSAAKDDGTVAIYSTADRRSAMEPVSRDAEVTEVVDDLKKDLKNKPRDLQSWVNLAQLYVAQMKLDDAETAARKALRLDIKSIEAKKVLAQVAIRRGQVGLATIILNGIDQDEAKDADVLNMRALIALTHKDSARAMALFQKALKLDPGNVSVRMNLGVSYLRYRQLGSAAVQFERVLKLVPDHADALLHLAVVKSSRGDHAAAEKIYEGILSRSQSNPLALYNLAVLQQRTGEFDQSLSSLKTFLKSSHAKAEDIHQALALIEKIRDLKVQKDGEAAADVDEIERVARRQVEEKRAAKATSKVEQNESVDPEVHELEDQLIED